MNNDVYGKKMENLRNTIYVKFVSKKKDYLKQTSEPGHMSHKIFDTDLIAIHKQKITLTLHKPVYTAMSILELSKVLIYKLHYGYIKSRKIMIIQTN